MEAYSGRVLLRRLGPFGLLAWMLAAVAMLHAQMLDAQTPAMFSDTGVAFFGAMSGAAELPTTAGVTGGVICGTVLDANGAEVEGATVTLEEASGGVVRSATTDNNGFFRFNSVGPGSLKVRVAATGFSNWTSDELVLRANEDYDLPPVELRIAESTTVVEVVSTRHDVAEAEMQAQEKQRVFGAIPNFYVSYQRDAEPLSSGQKYRLAWRTTIDPVTIAISAGVAGVEQSQRAFSGYGQGAQGYAKRFGAFYGDGFVDTFLTDAVLPSLLHQDPRYFYKGTGSVTSRALYAMASVVICKGDNGRWQPNYSNVLGNVAAAGVSNAYYPANNRDGAELTVRNSLIGTAAGAVGALFQEFLVKSLSRGIQP